MHKPLCVYEGPMLMHGDLREGDVRGVKMRVFDQKNEWEESIRVEPMRCIKQDLRFVFEEEGREEPETIVGLSIPQDG